MSRSVRSRFLLGAALAALSAATTASAAAATAHSSPGTFNPPAGPVLLTRELRKALSDGKEVVSRRRYAIRFHPNATGYRVEGELVGADVDAPPELAQLADVERTRSDEGLFPLALDRHGLILEQQGADDPAAAARTMAAARDFIVKAQMTDAERTAALAMVAKLQAQARAAGGNWPADLFRPASGEHQESRELPLPDGSTGKVTVTITATDAPGGLLDRLQRRVVTELGGSARLSTETWTLASLP